jgi:metal-responsive CopG/Arc/MetJ family transcriptional regulator
MKYFQKAWTVTSETLSELEKACELLRTDNRSYALRELVRLGVQELENLKTKQNKEGV